jgi:PhzF family phenazine biosynthesis protein
MSTTIKRYQVDAFAENIFEGNPAVVCPLTEWLPDALMQQIAMENNLSETAFYVKESAGYRIRWFTPAVEVDLCGHATLATAFVMFNHEKYGGEEISFQSRSGILKVSRNNGLLTLNFPADELREVEIQADLIEGFNDRPTKILKGKTDYMFVYESENQVRNCSPDFFKVAKIKARGIIITAPGKSHDFVSRFFGPQAGVNEDPVTGSAHTTLTPYWASVTGKKELKAAQLSARGGKLYCKLEGDRVSISGSARLFSEGLIYLP